MYEFNSSIYEVIQRIGLPISLTSAKLTLANRLAMCTVQRRRHPQNVEKFANIDIYYANCNNETKERQL